MSKLKEIIDRIERFFTGKKEEKFLPESKPSRSFLYDYRQQMRVDNLPKTIKKEEKTPNEPGLVVVSDLHGNINQWKIINEYIVNNPDKHVYILGDAIDRGDYGVEILQQIMEQSKRGKVTYLPGNHDAFTYNALSAILSEDPREMQIFNDDIQTCGLNNPDMKTLNKLNNLDKEKLAELMNWWGEQPFQEKIETSNGMGYAFAHAVFDEKLYKHDPKYNLRKAANDKRNGNNQYLSNLRNLLWYREGSNNSIDTENMVLPQGSIMIAGHTPQQGITNASSIKGVPIIYIDNSRNKNQMLGLIIDNKSIREIDLLMENIKRSER